MKRAPRRYRSFYRREAVLGLVERLIGQAADVNYVVCESSQDVARAKRRGRQKLAWKSRMIAYEGARRQKCNLLRGAGETPRGDVPVNSQLWRMKACVFQYAGMVNDEIRRHSFYLSLYGRVMVFRSNYRRG